MSDSGFVVYRRQVDALLHSPRTTDECDTARQVSELHEGGVRRYLTLAADYPPEHPKFGKKCYFAVTFREFFDFLRTAEQRQLVFYELLHHNVPSKMYFDLDGSAACEDNVRDAKFVRAHFLDDVAEFVKELAGKKEGKRAVAYCINWKQSDGPSPETMNRQKAEKLRNALWWEQSAMPWREGIVMDSSKRHKFSLHVIFPHLIMKNIYHCGALMRRFEVWLLRRYGYDPARNPYYFVREDGNGYTCVVDRGVYTTNRVMRLPWNSKSSREGPRPLCPSYRTVHNVRHHETRPTRAMFAKCLIQLTVPMPCDVGNEADLKMLLDDAHVFEICEARRAFDLECIEESSDTAAWIEPASIGNRIVTLTLDTIRKLKLTQYIPKSHARTRARSPLSGPRSSAASSVRRAVPSLGGTHTFSDVSNVLLMRHCVGQTHSTPSTPLQRTEAMRGAQARTHLITEIGRVALDVLYLMLPEWTWWHGDRRPQMYALRPETDIDIARGTVLLRPRNERYCGAKGAEHTSNHVYFYVYVRSGRDNKGGVRQFCHSSCADAGRTLYQSQKPQVVKKLKWMRRQMRELFKSRYSRTLDVPCGGERVFTVRRAHVVMLTREMGTAFRRFAHVVLDKRAANANVQSQRTLNNYLRRVDNIFTSYITNAPDNDDDDDDDEDDALMPCEDSMDYHDIDYGVLYSEENQKKRYVAVTDAVALSILARAVVRINGGDDARVRCAAHMLGQFRAWLVRCTWTAPDQCCGGTVWRGSVIDMVRDITVWQKGFGAARDCDSDRTGSLLQHGTDDDSALVAVETETVHAVERLCEHLRARRAKDVLSEDYEHFMRDCSKSVAKLFDFGARMGA